METTPKPETQATERSTIQPHGLSRICKPAVAGIGIVALAAITVACDSKSPKNAETPPAPTPTRALTADAERELTAGEDEIGGVFVVKKNGKIRVFRRSADRDDPSAPPFSTTQVKDLGGIAFIISNPKFCWETTDGDKKCITY